MGSSAQARMVAFREADTAYWVQHCWPCQARKRGGRISKWPQVLRDMPQSAFDSVAFDIFGPLSPSDAGHTHTLVVQDLYTRWVDLHPLSPEQNTADDIATILVDDYCTKHGVSRTLLNVHCVDTLCIPIILGGVQ